MLPAGTLERARAGDRDALSAVLEAHHGLVHRMLFRLVGPVEELDDLRQSVLLRIVEGLPRFRGESQLSTWIGGICVNVARSHFRDARRRRYVPADCDLTAAEGADPAAEADRRRQLERALATLDTLPTPQRMAFVLKAVLGHSVDEIATMMGAARSTTRLRLYWARRKFFAAIGEVPRGDARPAAAPGAVRAPGPEVTAVDAGPWSAGREGETPS